MKVDIVSRPDVRIAAVDHHGPYERVTEAFARLDAITRTSGLNGNNASLVAAYYDDPQTTPPDQLRADAGITIGSGSSLPSGSSDVRLAAGRYAHATHSGPYAGLPAAWRQLREWAANHGQRDADRPVYEVYRNTPMSVAPDELRTDLYLPLA